VGNFRVNKFWSVAITFIVVYGLVKWGIPALSREITALPFPLSVPSALMFIYMTLTVIALFLFVTFSDENMEEFLHPVKKFLRGDYSRLTRNLALGLFPLLAGWQVYGMVAPKAELPLALRIQHPSSNFPKSSEALKNPLENPSDADIESFIEQTRANEVVLIAQVMRDVEAWMEETEPEHMLAFFPTEAMQRFLQALATGDVDKETAKAALREKNLFEGRALYAMNCRPCHGDSVAGDGPMADGFKLRPINFTDNGTIETIVEGYTFWRVTNGGPGLPTEATPWDSAMPEWKLNLSEEERWKIILAEYELADKTQRIPESHE